MSTNIILHDLETFYENPDLIIVPTTLYRDVVLYQNQKRTIKTVERNVAEKYWSDKIPSMGEAPDLPLKDDYALDNAKFTQKKVFLNHDMWMSFVENAPIIVLDEATAFSDPENEYLIQKAFEKLIQNKTVVMIAHRLSTVRAADQIIVLENGRIVQRGNHKELMREDGLYRRFVGMRSQAIGWTLKGGKAHG